MAPVITKTLNNVTPHEHHPLVRMEAVVNNWNHPEFKCNGCDTHGSSSDIRYHCNQCPEFNLHEDCATCPKNLSTYIHRKHQVELVWRNENDLPCCDVCGDQVKGLYYACLEDDSSCKNFTLHPMCSKFPSHLKHKMDTKNHPLVFQKAAPSWCTICSVPCNSWRYRCEECGINIHLECVGIPCHDDQTTKLANEPEESKQKQQQQQQQQQHQPPPPNYGHSAPYSIPAPYQMQQQQYPQKQCYDPGFGYPPPQPYYGYPRMQQYYNYYQQPPPYASYYTYNMYPQQPAPAYYQQPITTYQGGASSSSSSSSGSKNKKRMYMCLRIAASLAISTAFGIPHIPF